MTYLIKETTFRPTTMTEKDVMTISEAARVLGMTMPGVIRAIERGALTEVKDDSASYHGRRLVLRGEIERLVRDRNGARGEPAAIPAETANGRTGAPGGAMIYPVESPSEFGD